MVKKYDQNDASRLSFTKSLAAESPRREMSDLKANARTESENLRTKSIRSPRASCVSVRVISVVKPKMSFWPLDSASAM